MLYSKDYPGVIWTMKSFLSKESSAVDNNVPLPSSQTVEV